MNANKTLPVTVVFFMLYNHLIIKSHKGIHNGMVWRVATHHKATHTEVPS